MSLTNVQGGLIASGLQNVGNLVSTLLTNKANQDINQAQMDYNTKMSQAQWERDDTAHQREVADLEKAGLSPLASLGGLNTSNPLGSPSMISNQAPQFDTSSFVQSVISQNSNSMKQQEINELKRHNQKTELQTDEGLYYQGKELEIQADSLNLENKKLQHQIQHDARMYALQDEQLNELIRHNKSIEEIQNNAEERQKIQSQAEQYYKSVQLQTGGKDVPIKTYGKDELQEYLSYRTIRNKALQQVIDEFEDAQKSVSASGSVGFSKNKSSFNVSGSGAYSRDKTFNYEKIIEQFNNQWPFPIYYSGDYKYDR